MSRSKSAKRDKKASWLQSLQDERVAKIAGMFSFMSAIYLCISFISYLSSWKADQDKVLQLSWGLLVKSGTDVSNWLGRLGALTAHFFFYYGFGLASFLFIPIFVHLGFRFIRKSGWLRLLRFSTHSLLVMALLSMILDFVFRSSYFPFGGAFGSRTNGIMSAYVGDIGLGVALIFTMITFVIWFFNPNFQKLQLQTFGSGDTDSFLDWSQAFKWSKSEENNPSPAMDAFRDSQSPSAGSASGLEVDFSDYAERGGLAATIGASADSFLPPMGPDLEIEDSVIVQHTEPITTKEPEQSDFSAPVQPVLDEEDSWEGDFPTSPYDPRADLSSYTPPSLELLNDYADQKFEIDRSELESNKNQIIATLLNYKIEIQKIKATIGPTVTLYEIVPAPGVRISRIKSLEDDIALSLSAQGIRIIAPIPGRGTIGIEVANKNKQTVALKELLKSDRFNDPKLELPIALGKNISNEVVVADLTKMPHLLIAGATGQGKSVGINTILMSLLYRKHPAEVKLVLIDPKKVELPIYSEIKDHFLAQLPNQEEAIITDTSKVIYTLNSLCIEMDQRYELLKAARVRNILEYNDKFINRRLNPEKGHKHLPYIVLIIDEFADLIMTAGKEVELPIGRLAQLARAVGIHLIIATQRPSVKIITGLIKANFPGRIAFKVSSNIDSRTILDCGGAERLIGRGDMLYSVGSDMIRLQCAFVDTPEVERVIKQISTQRSYGSPYFLPEYKGDEGDGGENMISSEDLDEMFEEAARLVVQSQHGSTSMIQRRLKLGYNRAGRIMDQLESMGIVGSGEGSKPREVLVFNEVELDHMLSRFKK